MNASKKGGDLSICQRPLELLRNLIRFDTTNPPGNERKTSVSPVRKPCLVTTTGIVRSTSPYTTR